MEGRWGGGMERQRGVEVAVGRWLGGCCEGAARDAWGRSCEVKGAAKVEAAVNRWLRGCCEEAARVCETGTR